MTDFSNFPPAPKSKQEIFDRAAAHLMKTRKPSYVRNETTGYATCQYGGSGCALRPFLPDDPETIRAWDGQGAITDMPSDWMPEWMQDRVRFLDKLQQAHDRGVGTRDLPDSQWFETWRERMIALAAEHGLSDAAVREEAKQ